MRGPLRTRFWAKVVAGVGAPDECWEWQAGHGANGYGNFWDGALVRPAHVVSYELNVGPVPPGHDVHHRCENRGCVNPRHLQALTEAAHVYAHDNAATRNASATHCPQGHSYSGANLYVEPSTGRRRCRVCRRGQLRRAKRRYETRKRRERWRDRRSAQAAGDRS